MKNEFTVRITEEGDVDAIYQDGLAEVLDAETKEVRRASNVEFETIDDKGGWTVRSAHDTELAIRRQAPCCLKPGPAYMVGTVGKLAMFDSREDALKWEVRFFWELTHREPAAKGPEIAYLTETEFDELPEYSLSLPTGTFIGKKWRCDHSVRHLGADHDWWMGEYVEDPDPKMVGIKWRKIAIVERKP